MRLWRVVGVVATATIASAGAFGASGSGTITTFAGNGKAGYSGDGGKATAAKLNFPEGVAVDGKGNVYIVEAVNFRVRKVSPGGTITTFAGTGKKGFSGDGGKATAAKLSFSYGVAVDEKGNVYIADSGNGRVRRVDPGGRITTIAGTGVPCCFTGDGGPATKGRLFFPNSVAVDAKGNLYIADNLAYRVRKVSPEGRITTFAGTGKSGDSGDGGRATSARLAYPFGVAADAKGNVYIADSLSHRVRMVSPAGKITTIAGTGKAGFSGDGGPATSAQLSSPHGLAVDGQGNLYIGDEHNARIRKVSRGTITTIAGMGQHGFYGDGKPATSALLSAPWGVAVDGKGNLLIADTNNHRVRIVRGVARASSAFAGSAAAGTCSKAEATAVVRRLGWSDLSTIAPVYKVLCGSFAGPGSRTMVASLYGPDNVGMLYWAVFRWSGSDWEPLLKRRQAALLSAARGDVQESVPVYRSGDPRCCPSGGERSRIWHWNGSRFVAGPWKRSTPGDAGARGFLSPSGNIACGMFDGAKNREVVCQSRVPPQKVTLDHTGRVTICRDPTPSNTSNECGIGDAGENKVPALAYGRHIIVERFRCDSLVTGVRCVVTATGKGFLINRDGVRRVGP